jgi:hypothetical protein
MEGKTNENQQKEEKVKVVYRTEDYRDDLVKGESIPHDKIEELLHTFEHFGPKD